MKRYILFIITLFSIISCEKEIIPSEKPAESNGLTPAINNLVPANVLHIMQDMNMPIFGGSNPPTIEGSYVIEPFQIIDSNIPGDNMSALFYPYYFRLYDQNNADLTIKLDFHNGTLSGNGLAAFIVGNDCNFSIFAEITAQENSHSAKIVNVISGSALSNGFGGVFLSNFMLDDHGDPDNVWIPNSTGRIFKDENGFSNKEGEEGYFYSGLPNCPCYYSDIEDGGKEMCGTWYKCGEADQEYHYGSKFEARWVPPRPSPGQQCTYDLTGKLIVGGIAAGSPDKVSPMSCGFLAWLNNQNGSNYSLDFEQHWLHDVQPWKELPCSEYLADWKANAGNNCDPNQTPNVVSGISNEVDGLDHLKKMIGTMSCEDAVILIKGAKETGAPLIDQDLRNYILGLHVGMTKLQCKAKLLNWSNNILFSNPPLYDILNIAITNLN